MTTGVASNTWDGLTDVHPVGLMVLAPQLRVDAAQERPAASRAELVETLHHHEDGRAQLARPRSRRTNSESATEL